MNTEINLNKPISEILSDMRRLAQDPKIKAHMQSGWNSVLDILEPHYLAMSPKPKSFEVHHMNETARKEFMIAYVAGRELQECVDRAVNKIKK